MSEWDNDLSAKNFPHLFPNGLGSPENKLDHPFEKISEKEKVNHYLWFADLTDTGAVYRFAEDYRYIFWAYNRIQRESTSQSVRL